MKNTENIKTALYEEHVKLDGKMIPFAGYIMPVNYTHGIKNEYKSIRNDIGVFDVSHMGYIKISGQESEHLLNFITTNNVSKISDYSAQYNTICKSDGGTIDDIIVYRVNKESYFIIVNASNINKDYNWIIDNNNFNCKVENLSKFKSLIAIQGPNSRKKIFEIFNLDLKGLEFYKFIESNLFNEKLIISRTGYTGELGFELIANHDVIVKIWKILIKNNIQPCGLGVRDILRMEMKYCLYGNDLLENINPIQANLKWIVDFGKENFIGKKKLLEEFDNPTKRLLCFRMIDRAIPRKGYNVFFENKNIGVVSSGSFSLGLSKGIGLAFIKAEYIKNKNIFIEIRKELFKAEIIKPPFIDKFSLHS
tara:strand:+ start:206 stop:1300 length:1095 start_codon:yes stop_codon:yes gene_type:complete